MFLLKPRKTMSYSHFFNFIDKDKIEVLFEVGANNGNDTLIINNHFNPNEYHIFEPTKSNFEKLNSLFCDSTHPHFKLNNVAVYKKQGLRDFYLCKSNSGSSSLLGKVQKEFCEIADEECNLPLEQRQKRLQEYCTDIDWTKTEVKCIRLDDYCAQNNVSDIDLICIDAEGVGLSILMSLGNLIKKVRYIICECDYGFTRKNEETFDDINNFLKKYGFEIIENKYQVSILSDCLWKNTNYV